MQEDKELHGPTLESQRAPGKEPTARRKALPHFAAYTLLLLTASCIAVAFWLALSQRGSAVVRPAATVAIAGLAGGLVCVSTRETRSFDEGQWILAVYSWLLTALAGASTSLALFVLASVAFPSTGYFQYAGLGMFGAITGYLGASVAMAGAFKWRPSLKSPLDRVSREFNLQVERLLPSLQPRVNQVLEELILGPPIPPYNGYVAVTCSRHTAADANISATQEQAGVGFAVWFDTNRPDTGAMAIPESNSPRKIYPIIVRGQGSPDLRDAGQDGVTQFDVLLHIPTSATSPIRRSLSVPLSGRSKPLSFFVASTDLEKGAIPGDSLLELRCRGALIQIIDLHDLVLLFSNTMTYFSSFKCSKSRRLGIRRIVSNAANEPFFCGLVSGGT